MSTTTNPRYAEAYEDDCTHDDDCEVHTAEQRRHPSHNDQKQCAYCATTLRASDPDVCERCDEHGL